MSNLVLSDTDLAVGIHPQTFDTIDTDTLVALGAPLARRLQVDHWVLGDWVVALQDRLAPSEANALLVAVGIDPVDAGRSQSIAVSVPHDVRRPSLSWTHHTKVRKMPRDQQVRWLGLAETHGWSARELAQRIADTLEQPALPGLERLPRPSERMLRRALESGARTVLWAPGTDGGVEALGAAEVLHVQPRPGGRAVLAVEVDAETAEVLAGQVRGVAA